MLTLPDFPAALYPAEGVFRRSATHRCDRCDRRRKRSLHALSSIDPTARAALVAGAGRRRYRRNETIVHAEDEGQTFFLVEAGHAAVRVVTEYGDTTTFAVLGPGDSFGELALLSDAHRRSASIVALEHLSVLTLSRAHLESTLGQAGVHRLLVQVLANQVLRLSGQLVEARFVPVRHRVARALLALARPVPRRRPAGRACWSRRTTWRGLPAPRGRR